MLRFLHHHVSKLRLLLPLSLLLCAHSFAQDDAKKDDAKPSDTVVFKSDVALTRVDAQVLDRDGRAIKGLEVEDFVLKVDGKVVPIRNFASENMPLDVLLLLDVSGSMGPHVQRIAEAAHEALNVLAEHDRVAIMIFDTNTRVRLPFKSNHTDVTNELNRILRSERFNGGTRITRAMLDAAAYLQKQGRPEARRAIVILTDDQTQDEEDEARVESALARANAVMSFLQAPYEPPGVMGPGGGPRRSPGTWGSGGGWPGSGGGIGFPGGGIGLPGGRGGGYGVDPSHTAGTATIASDSGGDVMQVSDASALEDTLARLRQRYALHYYVPEDARPSEQRTVLVTLSKDAKRRYQEADVRYRRVYMAGNSERSGPTVVTHTRAPVEEVSDPAASDSQPTPKRRRVAVNEDTGGPHTVEPEPHPASPETDSAPTQAAPPSTDDSRLPKLINKSPTSKPDQQTPSQGWPKADPPVPPPNQ